MTEELNKKQREEVAPNIWLTIEREYNHCVDKIESIKKELEREQKLLVDYADFLENHTYK